MKRLILLSIFLVLNMTIYCQEHQFIVRVPVYSEFDNVQFKNLESFLVVGSEPFPHYQIKEHSWKTGAIFQIIQQCKGPKMYTYILGMDSDDKVEILSSTEVGNRQELDEKPVISEKKYVHPSIREGISINKKGTYQIAILVSPEPLSEVDSVCHKIREKDGSLKSRLRAVFVDEIEKVDYFQNEVGFKCSRLKNIAPVFLSLKAEEKEPLPLPKPNLHVVSIGVKHLDLKYTIKDAQDIADCLSENGKKFYNKITVEKLIGEQATKGRILSLLEEIAHKYEQQLIRPEDKLIVYLSSHGAISSNDELYISASNYNYLNPRGTSVRYNEIYQILKSVKCNKIILVDVSASRSKQVEPPFVVSPESPIKPIQEEKFFPIVSNGVAEASYENLAWENGAFTQALLEGLGGSADLEKDGILYLSELFQFTRIRTAQLVKEKLNKDQHPTMLRPGFIDFPILAF